MNIQDIRQLAELMEEKNLENLEFSEGETHIRLARAGNRPSPAPQPCVQPSVAAPQAEVAPQPQPEPQPALAGELLPSPLVGVAYVAGAPGEKPFAPIGEKVKKGQVLCIIEAMKVMNEFVAPSAGEILEVCFEDGQLVEYGQPLFRIS